MSFVHTHALRRCYVALVLRCVASGNAKDIDFCQSVKNTWKQKREISLGAGKYAQVLWFQTEKTRKIIWVWTGCEKQHRCRNGRKSLVIDLVDADRLCDLNEDQFVEEIAQQPFNGFHVTSSGKHFFLLEKPRSQSRICAVLVSAEAIGRGGGIFPEGIGKSALCFLFMKHRTESAVLDSSRAECTDVWETFLFMEKLFDKFVLFSD